MEAETQAWLRGLDELGARAKRLIERGQQPTTAIIAMASTAVEPDVNYLKISEDLKLDSPNSFWAQIDLFLFAKSVIQDLT